MLQINNPLEDYIALCINIFLMRNVDDNVII